MSDSHVDGKVIKELIEGKEWVTDRLASADKVARSFLTEHPFISLACAVGVGFLAARLLRSKT